MQARTTIPTDSVDYSRSFKQTGQAGSIGKPSGLYWVRISVGTLGFPTEVVRGIPQCLQSHASFHIPCSSSPTVSTTKRRLISITAIRRSDRQSGPRGTRNREPTASIHTAWP